MGETAVTPTKTSRESWRLIQPKLGKRQRQVLQVFLDSPSTWVWSDRELSMMTHLPINVVTPRRGELYKKGLIEPADVRWDDETKRRVQMWRLK